MSIYVHCSGPRQTRPCHMPSPEKEGKWEICNSVQLLCRFPEATGTRVEMAVLITCACCSNIDLDDDWTTVTAGSSLKAIHRLCIRAGRTLYVRTTSLAMSGFLLYRRRCSTQRQTGQCANKGRPLLLLLLLGRLRVFPVQNSFIYLCVWWILMIFPHGAIHTIIRDATVPRAPRSRCRPIRKKLIFRWKEKKEKTKTKLPNSWSLLSFSDLAGRVISSSFFFNDIHPPIACRHRAKAPHLVRINIPLPSAGEERRTHTHTQEPPFFSFSTTTKSSSEQWAFHFFSPLSPFKNFLGRK